LRSWIALLGRRLTGAEYVDALRGQQRIDTADYLIAATAIVLDAPLLTTNVRHFPMLKGLRPAY